MEDDVSPTIVEKITSYLSTDKVDRILNSVLTNINTPIGFTRHTLQNKADFLYQEYAKDIHDKFNKIPKIIRDAWVYEHIFRSTLSHRLNYLFADNEEALLQMSLNVDRSFLLLYDPQVPASLYVGFMYFKDNCQPFFGEYPVPSNADRIGLTRRFVSTIGNITDDDWIFHNRLWFDTINADRGLLRTLRGFVQLAYTNIFYTEDIFEAIHGISIAELLDHVEMFIELRESVDTTRSDIIKFIEYVEHYALETSPSGFYHMLCGGSFVDLKQSILVQPKHEVITYIESPFQKHNIITCLTTMCEEHSIARILDDSFYPEYLAAELYTAHYSDLVEHFLPLLYNDDWFVPAYQPLLNHLPKNKKLLNQILYDHLIIATVGFRVSHIHNQEMDYVMNYLVNTSHILLNMEDETETMGLSMISTLLPFYIRINYKCFSERELETLMLVQWAWTSCRYDKPNRLSKLWKKHFSNPLVTRGLRRTFFSLFEVLNADTAIDFPTMFGMERADFFLYLENLCDYITSNPMTQEVEELFSKSPRPNKSLFLTQEDCLIWIGHKEDLDDQS